jgi:hypothetical protein
MCLRQRGIMLAVMDGRIRPCTHLDVTAPMIEDTVGLVREIVNNRYWLSAISFIGREPQRCQHRGEEHREQHGHDRCLAQIMYAPDMAGCISHLAALADQPWRQMGEA